MTIQDTFKTALKGLQTNQSRSVLTILGIVIGITAIILMMSIGKGAEALILNEIGGLGAETIIVRPGKEPSGPSDFGSSLFTDSLKIRDVEALNRKENAQHILQVMPVLIVPGSVSYSGETFRPTILGGVITFFTDVFRAHIIEGAPFGDAEIEAKASVAVIGTKVKEELFGASDPLNEYIKIKDREFRVVGIFSSQGQTAFFNIDELVVVPYTTAQTYLVGTDHFHEIIVKTDSPVNVERTVRDIELTLRESHNIQSPEDDDFFIITQEGVVAQIQNILGALTIFLSSVVAIALVVGGIGVMNIMLVSVTERTREIGLRKAIGAADKDIMMQFLFEAVILTAIGGIIGVILGGLLSFGSSYAFARFAGFDWPFVFPISAVFLGLGVSAFVGIVFGLYPARQASKKSPIEALSYE